MNSLEYSQKLAEVDRLLNDPDVPMEPVRIWSLLEELSTHGDTSDLTVR